jgi:predicted aldo/keto reductase-like oxidoreductase
LGRTGVELSLIGLGGVVVREAEQPFTNNLVAEAIDRGVNYFDVAPSYGKAQALYGPALQPYRQRVFLACKTLKRDKEGAAVELDQSLRDLRTDHVDLYQFHALTKMADLDQIFGPNGAMETFQAARQVGKIRFIGFSAHSVETALAALNRYDFDTILFPVNYVCFSQANFGPQVLERARQKNVGILAIKGMAPTKWPESFKERPAPGDWYQPAAAPKIAALALRWTLAHPITAAVPPGNEHDFRLAIDVVQPIKPLSQKEQETLMTLATGAEPIFRLGNF